MSDGMFLAVVLIVCGAVLAGCEVWRLREDLRRDPELREALRGRR